MGHVDRAREFVADADRTDWHDRALWFVRTKRDRAADLVPDWEALRERATNSGFDFIDFWAVDFAWSEGDPFEHHWQDYRTRKDRSLKTVSDAGYDRYPHPGIYTACVKVVDVFGCDTSITVEVGHE